jgi:hypothetical protein
MMANDLHRSDVDDLEVDEKPVDIQNEFEPARKAGYGSASTDDADTHALTRKLLWKLDIRYVCSSFGLDTLHTQPTSVESSQSSPSSFCVRFSTARMSATPKSSVLKKMSA